MLVELVELVDLRPNELTDASAFASLDPKLKPLAGDLAWRTAALAAAR
jgi:hypothetical protein